MTTRRSFRVLLTATANAEISEAALLADLVGSRKRFRNA